MTSAESLKGRLPFRLGTTSYIIPDGLEQNLRWLAGHVEEMQLVLFETPELSNIPTKTEAKNLKTLADDLGMTLTVHLPASIELGDAETSCRRRSAELFRRTVEATLPLGPLLWVFHIVGSEQFTSLAAIDSGELETQTARAAESLSGLMGLFDDSRRLAIENVLTHFTIEPPFIREFDTSVCIDVGHLHCYGQDVSEHLSRWLPRCSCVHIHGTNAVGKDHSSLGCMGREQIAYVLRRLRTAGYKGSFILEIFGEEDFAGSIEALKAALAD